jgi:hypothetical protein
MNEAIYEAVIRELTEYKDDIRPSDIILFSEPLRSALNFVIRLGRFSLTEFAEKLPFQREETKRIADLLVKRNLFTIASYSTAEETYYESRLTAMTRPLKRPSSDIWKKANLD